MSLCSVVKELEIDRYFASLPVTMFTAFRHQKAPAFLYKCEVLYWRMHNE